MRQLSRRPVRLNMAVSMTNYLKQPTFAKHFVLTDDFFVRKRKNATLMPYNTDEGIQTLSSTLEIW